MRTYEWDSDWEEVLAKHRASKFVSIDPGKYGALISERGFAYKLDEDLSVYDFDLTVIEGQYVGVNPRAALRLSFGAGVLCGQLGRDVLIVPPTVWQSSVLPPVKGRSALAVEAAKLAEHHMGLRMPAWSNKALEGVHSAMCIRQWWLWARDNADGGDSMGEQ